MRRISLCFCILHSVCMVHAFQASNSYNLSIQAQDSVTIKGHFIWKDSSITGYPPIVKITSIVNPQEQFIQQVVSLSLTGIFHRRNPGMENIGVVVCRGQFSLFHIAALLQTQKQVWLSSQLQKAFLR